MGALGDRRGRDWTAFILAAAVCLALNLICLAAVFDAINNDEGLSENATQVISGAIGGIVGILGSYLGFHRGIDQSARDALQSVADEEAPSKPDEEAPLSD